MEIEDIKNIIGKTQRYNLHSHTQYCDGHAPLSEIVEGAYRRGSEVWGVTPHSPLCQPSPCNMRAEDVPAYLDEMESLKERYQGKMALLTGMEIDYMSRDWGPHIDYFQRLPLEYRIGSVHFVPTQEGVWLDCDGKFERFSRYLREGYHDDLRYVVEKYFEQVLTMIEIGGFEILGHFDKIIGNAALADPTFEDQGWYASLIADVISHSRRAGLIVEINTKAIESKGRYFPARRWWDMLTAAGTPLAINSDCHHPDLTETGREEAYRELSKIKC